MYKRVQQLYWLFKSDKKQETPYLSTLLTLVGIVFMQLVIVALIFNIPAKYIFPFNPKSLILKRWLNGLIYPTLLIFVFALVYPKSRLEKESYKGGNLKKNRIFFIIIFIVQFMILFFLLIKNGQNRGLITC